MTKKSLEQQYQQYSDNLDFINAMRAVHGTPGEIPKKTFEQWVDCVTDFKIKCYEENTPWKLSLIGLNT